MTAAPLFDPADDARIYAHDYARRGWRVLPIRPGEKRPPMTAWQNAATTDAQLIDSWWTQLYRDHGVGIATGHGSGIFVLDVDIAGGKTGDETLADLQTRHGRLPDTATVITASRGQHLYYRLPAGTDIRNNAGTRLGPGLDIRGEGGQVVAPPTRIGDRSYEWDGGEPGDIADPPAWLLELLTTEPAPAPAITHTTSDDPADSVAARYNAATTWQQLLTADGWTLNHTTASGEQRWTRPGKDTKDGASATVGHQGRDCLMVFTDGVAGLEQERAYSRFGYTAAVHHGGDRSGFATALARAETAPHDRWFDTLPDIAAPTPPADTYLPGQLPDPIPLDTGHRHGPPFPLHALPAWIADMCTEVEWSYQVPADLPAMLALGCLSTLTAGKIRINVAGTAWTEHTNLYLVTAMPPGSGKSPVFKKMTKAVREIEKRSRARAKALNHEIEARRSMLEKRRTELQKTAEPGEHGIRALAEIIGEIDELERPSDGAMVVEDITPEALVESLAENSGRLALLSSEGGVFDMMAGQYMDRGKATNLAVYLQGWSADEVRRKRKGSTDFIINEAILTICITTQPGVVATLGANKELVRKGVPTRFMYSAPPSLVGYRDRRRVRTTVSDDVDELYNRLMVQIGDRCLTVEHPTTLLLDDEASDAFLAWDQHLEERQRPRGDLAERAEWAAKLRASVLRVAALLHVAHNAEQGLRAAYGDVGIDALNAAITIGTYWLDHAEVIERLWTDDADVNRAATLLDLLVDAGTDEFTLRDAYDLKRGTFPTAGDAIGPLQILVDRNWVQPHQAEPVAMSGRGKAGQRFSLRPDAGSFRRATAQPAQLHENDGQVARVARVARKERGFHPPTHTPSSTPEIDKTSAQPAQPAQLDDLPPTGTDPEPFRPF